MKANLNLLALYNWDNTLFDKLVVPATIDKRTVVDNLLLECGELEVVYASFPVMYAAIGYWSKKCLPIWERMQKAMSEEYNPLHNYDRTETHTLKETRDLVQNLESKSKGVNGGTDQLIHSNATYNDPDLVASDKNDTIYGATSDLNGTGKTTDSGTITHQNEIRAFGNIGVTTSQQMLQSEIDIAKFTVTDYIIAEFKARFCLGVY